MGVTAVLRTAVLLWYRVVGLWISSFLWCVAVVYPHGFVGYFILGGGQNKVYIVAIWPKQGAG